MNGVHDMGGMHGMGPIEREENEPVFHSCWEGRVFALSMAVDAWGKSNIDASRHREELIPAAAYLRMSYFERWLTGLVDLLLQSGLSTPAEIQSGKPAPGSPKAVPPLKAHQVAAMIARGDPVSRDVRAASLFRVGQRVRARNINPTTHTRLPRYARGKFGMVERDHGVFVFPDSNARSLGERPQHVYSVRFAARELWGAEAKPVDSVYVDLSEDYLEPA